MTLDGIFSSPSQRRRFLFATAALVTACIFVIFAIAIKAPSTPVWNCVNNLLISIVSSAAFAIIAALYVSYFFIDPTENDTKTTLLPEDIGPTLIRIAASATEYRIFVRTGRHFRAEIMPVIVERAKRLRHPAKIYVVLLDCRDDQICEKYADFRKCSSFDSKNWSKTAVQKEVLSTILAILETADTNRSLVEIQLFLSKRLSSFRIEGSSDEILVTREDPKDTAYRYLRNHRDFGAYLTELTWICEEASQISILEKGRIATLTDIFGENHSLLTLENMAKKLKNADSPYAR